MSRILGRRRLFLMRHGHVDYFAPRVTDFRLVPLTEEGQAQAEAAGEALSSVQFDAVYHSGLPRTVETAQLVLSHNLSGFSDALMKSIPGLEELRGGTFVTDSREELAARLAFSFEEAAQPGAAFLPGGEFFSDAYKRVIEAFESVVFKHEWRTGLLVAHEGVNRLLLGYASRAGLSGVSAFEQDLGCINVIDLDIVDGGDGAPKIQRILLKAINITPYDYLKAGLPKTSLEHLFDIDFRGARIATEVR